MATEQEYLLNYRLEDYERPSVTTDIAAFMIRNEEEESYRKNPKSVLTLLLVKRGNHPYKDCWALPGGFLQPDETVEACALREVTEETGITPSALMPVAVFSEPGRDPRGWVISHAYASIINEDGVTARGGDDAAEADWFAVSFEEEDAGHFVLQLTRGDLCLKAVLTEKKTRFGVTDFEIADSGNLAFDHARIIATALRALRSKTKHFEYIFDFLPERFTLTALQKVQETVMNIEVLPANFRRKVADYVEETDEYVSGAGHRPAKLYRKK